VVAVSFVFVVSRHVVVVSRRAFARRAFARRAVAIVVVFGRRSRRRSRRRRWSLSSSPITILVVFVVSRRAFAGRAQ
jgi:hypothetical protein